MAQTKKLKVQFKFSYALGTLGKEKSK